MRLQHWISRILFGDFYHSASGRNEIGTSNKYYCTAEVYLSFLSMSYFLCVFPWKYFTFGVTNEMLHATYNYYS
jgi:hypothetical protein